MAEDVSTQECMRLARAMTFKNAAAGLPHGGDKAVLCGDPKMATVKITSPTSRSPNISGF